MPPKMSKEAYAKLKKQREEEKKNSAGKRSRRSSTRAGADEDQEAGEDGADGNEDAMEMDDSLIPPPEPVNATIPAGGTRTTRSGRALGSSASPATRQSKSAESIPQEEKEKDTSASNPFAAALASAKKSSRSPSTSSSAAKGHGPGASSVSKELLDTAERKIKDLEVKLNNSTSERNKLEQQLQGLTKQDTAGKPIETAKESLHANRNNIALQSLRVPRIRLVS